MKVFKNLFGDGSKINVNEIAVTPKLLLGESVILEQGSNSDGEWVRFGNGLQLCWGEQIIDAIINNSWGSIYYADSIGFNYAKSFFEQPKVQITAITQTLLNIVLRGGPNVTGTGNIRLLRPTSTSNRAEYSMHYMAIGRWR